MENLQLTKTIEDNNVIFESNKVTKDTGDTIKYNVGSVIEIFTSMPLVKGLESQMEFDFDNNVFTLILDKHDIHIDQYKMFELLYDYYYNNVNFVNNEILSDFVSAIKNESFIKNLNGTLVDYNELKLNTSVELYDSNNNLIAIANMIGMQYTNQRFKILIPNLISIVSLEDHSYSIKVQIGNKVLSSDKVTLVTTDSIMNLNCAKLSCMANYIFEEGSTSTEQLNIKLNGISTEDIKFDGENLTENILKKINNNNSMEMISEYVVKAKEILAKEQEKKTFIDTDFLEDLL